VVDFPLQPHFHGETWRGPVPYGPGGSMIQGVCGPYSWMPAWAGRAWTEDEVVEKVSEFDLVVLASPRAYNVPCLRKLIERVGRSSIKRLVMLDGEDYTAIRWDLANEFRPEVYFKTSLVPEPLDLYPAQRELMQSRTRVLPCPLTTSFNEPPCVEKEYDVCFLGGSNWFGTRREGVEENRVPVKAAVEAELRRRLPDARLMLGHVPYDQYTPLLAASQVAICVSGHGLEGMRTFEAMSCSNTLVVREALPQITPWPMIDGVHCVTYSHHEEIAGLCETVLDPLHRGSRERIARAGYELVWKHYTTRARARYILDESFR